MFKNIKLKYKLFFILGIPTVALVLSTFLASSDLRSLHQNLTVSLHDENAIFTEKVLNADRDFHQSHIALSEMVYTEVQGEDLKTLTEGYKNNAKQTYDNVQNAKEALIKNESKFLHFKDEEGKTFSDYIEKFEEDYEKWLNLTTIIVQNINQSPEQERSQFILPLKESVQVFDQTRDQIDKMTELIEKNSLSNIEKK